jgi:uncharacterized phage-associated protein
MTNAMKSPYTGNEMPLKIELREFEFRKEKFTIQFHYYLCGQSGEEFESQQQSEINHAQVVNQYRAKHHIPFPEEITATKEKYGLSARQMSQILGFGINQYSLYEQGEIPSISNGISISMASNPHAFEQLVQTCSELSESARQKVLQKISMEKRKTPAAVELLLPFQNPGVKNGFRRFDFPRFTNLVIYFSAMVNPFKVKMNKLLFYTDFAHYKYHGRSITGLNYEAIQMGPVPAHYQLLFDISKGRDTFNIEEIWFEDAGPSGEKFSADINSFNKEIFSENELEIINLVTKKFKNTTTNDIIKLSHDETGWKENVTDKELIPYSAAMNLIHL